MLTPHTQCHRTCTASKVYNPNPREMRAPDRRTPLAVVDEALLIESTVIRIIQADVLKMFMAINKIELRQFFFPICLSIFNHFLKIKLIYGYKVQ